MCSARPVVKGSVQVGLAVLCIAEQAEPLGLLGCLRALATVIIAILKLRDRLLHQRASNIHLERARTAASEVNLPLRPLHLGITRSIKLFAARAGAKVLKSVEPRCADEARRDVLLGGVPREVQVEHVLGVRLGQRV